MSKLVLLYSNDPWTLWLDLTTVLRIQAGLAQLGSNDKIVSFPTSMACGQSDQGPRFSA